MIGLVRRSRLPIRLWLQSASFLAVLAGYALLVVANRQLLELQRLRRHDQRVATVVERLEQAPSAEPLAPLLRQLSTPGLVVSLAASCPKAARRPPFGAADYYGLTLSCRRLLLQGQPRLVVFAEDTSEAVADEVRFTLLLAAAAGLAALLTSALLRLVLREGLEPLARFSATLDSIGAANLADRRLPLDDQPAELQPIARAFNDLLDRLSSSWEHQRTFVNAVSHELRTPITLIGGYAGRLQRRVANLTEPQREQLQLIHGEASRMGRLVSDLLEIARDDAGRLEVKREPLDAWAALVAVQQRLGPSVGSRLQLDPPPDGALPVWGDEARLQQCLTNLIENAVKYAPGGTPITLAASLEPDGSGVVLHVIDQGPGVPAPDRARIFERFVRGSSAATAERPGSGIGLAVVQTLMRRMGGEALVADAPGGGADFQLHLVPAQPRNNGSTPSSSSVFTR